MKYVRPVNHDIVPYKHFTRRDVSNASSVFHSVFLEVLSGDWTPAYYVPLEVVLSHPGQLVVPRVARRWHIDSAKVIFFGLPELQARKVNDGFGEYMSRPSFYLVEHYDDSGSDGHTYYKPAGWLIVDSDQLELMSDINAAMTYSLDYVSLPDYKERTKVQSDLQPELPEIAEPALVPPVKRVRRHETWVRSPDLDDDIVESLGGDPYLVGELQFDVSSFELGVVDVNSILNDKSLDDAEIKRPVVTGHSVSGQFWPSPSGPFQVQTNAMPDGSLDIQLSSDDPKVDLRKHAESIAEWALGQVPADKSGSFEIKVTGPLPTEARLIDSGDDL